MSIHHLKINRQPFEDLVSGLKTCEVRDCSDRDFKVGDSVELFMTETVTGLATESIIRTITHIQRGYGLPDDICVLSYAAPVVERQKPHQIHDCCTNCLQGNDTHSDDGKCPSPNTTIWHAWDYDFAPGTSAPEAEQHPIAYMRNEGTPNNLVQCSFTCPGAFGVYRGPQSLSAMPAPVAAIDPVLGSAPEDHMRWLLDKVVNPSDYPQSVLDDQIRDTLARLDKVKELNQ